MKNVRLFLFAVVFLGSLSSSKFVNAQTDTPGEITADFEVSGSGTVAGLRVLSGSGTVVLPISANVTLDQITCVAENQSTGTKYTVIATITSTIAANGKITYTYQVQANGAWAVPTGYYKLWAVGDILRIDDGSSYQLKSSVMAKLVN